MLADNTQTIRNISPKRISMKARDRLKHLVRHSQDFEGNHQHVEQGSPVKKNGTVNKKQSNSVSRDPDLISEEKTQINIETPIRNAHMLMEDSQDDAPSKMYLTYMGQ